MNGTLLLRPSSEQKPQKQKKSLSSARPTTKVRIGKEAFSLLANRSSLGVYKPRGSKAKPQVLHAQGLIKAPPRINNKLPEASPKTAPLTLFSPLEKKTYQPAYEVAFLPPAPSGPKLYSLGSKVLPISIDESIITPQDEQVYWGLGHKPTDSILFQIKKKKSKSDDPKLSRFIQIVNPKRAKPEIYRAKNTSLTIGVPYGDLINLRNTHKVIKFRLLVAQNKNDIIHKGPWQTSTILSLTDFVGQSVELKTGVGFRARALPGPETFKKRPSNRFRGNLRILLKEGALLRNLEKDLLGRKFVISKANFNLKRPGYILMQKGKAVGWLSPDSPKENAKKLTQSLKADFCFRGQYSSYLGTVKNYRKSSNQKDLYVFKENELIKIDDFVLKTVSLQQVIKNTNSQVFSKKVEVLR